MINQLKDSLSIIDLEKRPGTMTRRFRDWAFNVTRDASVGDWTDVTFENSWVNVGSGFNNAQFRRLGATQVELRGLIENGTVITNFFTLPEGFRPPSRYLFVVNANDVFARVDILANGEVTQVLGGNNFVSLDGIIFSTV